MFEILDIVGCLKPNFSLIAESQHNFGRGLWFIRNARLSRGLQRSVFKLVKVSGKIRHNSGNIGLGPAEILPRNRVEVGGKRHMV